MCKLLRRKFARFAKDFIVLRVSIRVYIDSRHRDLEFSVGDVIFLRVSSYRGVMRFARSGKLVPRYIGPLRYLIELVCLLIEWLYCQHCPAFPTSFKCHP